MVRPEYSGDKRSLVLAFDIGTTFSGVSYVLLDPGQIPKINSVVRYASPLIPATMSNSSERLPQVSRASSVASQNSLHNVVRLKWKAPLFWSGGHAFGNNR